MEERVLYHSSLCSLIAHRCCSFLLSKNTYAPSQIQTTKRKKSVLSLRLRFPFTYFLSFFNILQFTSACHETGWILEGLHVCIYIYIYIYIYIHTCKNIHIRVCTCIFGGFEPCFFTYMLTIILCYFLIFICTVCETRQEKQKAKTKVG